MYSIFAIIIYLLFLIIINYFYGWIMSLSIQQDYYAKSFPNQMSLTNLLFLSSLSMTILLVILSISLQYIFKNN